MNGAVGDPVLLSQRRRRVDDELFGLGVVVDGRLHLDGVVAVAQFREAETADIIEVIDAFEIARVASFCTNSTRLNSIL